MLSQKLNDQITRIGSGTPAGSVLRQYWQPAALSDDLEGSFPVPVNLLGERLALVRTASGELSLKTRESDINEPPPFTLIVMTYASRTTEMSIL